MPLCPGTRLYPPAAACWVGAAKNRAAGAGKRESGRRPARAAALAAAAASRDDPRLGKPALQSAAAPARSGRARAAPEGRVCRRWQDAVAWGAPPSAAARLTAGVCVIRKRLSSRGERPTLCAAAARVVRSSLGTAEARSLVCPLAACRPLPCSQSSPHQQGQFDAASEARMVQANRRRRRCRLAGGCGSIVKASQLQQQAAIAAHSLARRCLQRRCLQPHGDGEMRRRRTPSCKAEHDGQRCRGRLISLRARSRISIDPCGRREGAMSSKCRESNAAAAGRRLSAHSLAQATMARPGAAGGGGGQEAQAAACLRDRRAVLSLSLRAWHSLQGVKFAELG